MAGESVRPKGSRYSPDVTYGSAALVATLLLALLLYFWLDWSAYVVWLVGCNLVTFLFFRYDKRRAAQPGAMRIPEIVLHLLVLAGGVVGGAFGMLLRPRHKTQKPIFWIVLIAGALLHLGLIYVWFL
jgi:uncharacterized membrane protein YsdA (DUF1294 family)